MANEPRWGGAMAGEIREDREKRWRLGTRRAMAAGLEEDGRGSGGRGGGQGRENITEGAREGGGLVASFS
uniref:DUF834 domain-containing protein n=1 Tax=Oryza punctata TaxID=4537 RepID=A0A0E0LP45_ORYPU